MTVGTVDEKWRVTIPKEVRARGNISVRSPVDIKWSRKQMVVVFLRKKRSAKRADTLNWLLRHPAKVDPEKLKRIDLGRIKNEMWFA